MNSLSTLQNFRQQSLGFLIQVLARRINGSMSNKLKELNIDLKFFVNLMELNQNDGIIQKDLASMVDFPEYATSRNVDAMIDAGYVERRPDPNSRRSIRIFLTPAGSKIAKKLPKIVNKTNEEFLEKLSNKEQKELKRLLRKVLNISESGDPTL